MCKMFVLVVVCVWGGVTVYVSVLYHNATFSFPILFQPQVSAYNRDGQGFIYGNFLSANFSREL